MRTATLQRTKSGDSGTFGVLTTDTGKSWHSGELPWRNNSRGYSCIPDGEYLCLWQYSPSHGRQVYHLQDVPCRTDVELHPGNWCGDIEKGMKSDVKGCIILGKSFGQADGQDAVLQSKKAIAEFETEMCCDSFTLTVKEVV